LTVEAIISSIGPVFFHPPFGPLTYFGQRVLDQHQSHVWEAVAVAGFGIAWLISNAAFVVTRQAPRELRPVR